MNQLLLALLLVGTSTAAAQLGDAVSAAETTTGAAAAAASGSPPPSPPLASAAGVACSGAPPNTPYVLAWACASGVPDGGTCSGSCVAGTTGSATATCAAGKWGGIKNACLIGATYGFDDVISDGLPVPNQYLGLQWTGMRVTNSQRFTACDSYNGFRNGNVSPPNVGYTLEAGAAQVGNVTVAASSAASVVAPSPAQRITVLGLYATAAWQDGLMLHLTSWAADGSMLAVKPVALSFLRPTYIDLSKEAGFSGIYKLGLVGYGGVKLSCSSGTNVVVDSIDIRLHPDATSS